MRYGLVLILFGVVVAGSAGAEEMPDLSVEAAESAMNAVRATKTVDGHHFVVAVDRPIEKSGAGYKPVDIDAYVAVKTRRLEEAMEERMRSFAARLEILTQRVAILEAFFKDHNEENSEPAPSPAVLLPD
jgi:hypothetical protein